MALGCSYNLPTIITTYFKSYYVSNHVLQTQYVLPPAETQRI